MGESLETKSGLLDACLDNLEFLTNMISPFY